MVNKVLMVNELSIPWVDFDQQEKMLDCTVTFKSIVVSGFLKTA